MLVKAVEPVGELYPAVTPAPVLRVKVRMASAVVSAHETLAPPRPRIHAHGHVAQFVTSCWIPPVQAPAALVIVAQSGPQAGPKFALLDASDTRVVRTLPPHWSFGAVVPAAAKHRNATPDLKPPTLAPEGVCHSKSQWNPVPATSTVARFWARLRVPEVDDKPQAPHVFLEIATGLPPYLCLPLVSESGLPLSFESSFSGRLSGAGIPGLWLGTPAMADTVSLLKPAPESGYALTPARDEAAIHLFSSIPAPANWRGRVAGGDLTSTGPIDVNVPAPLFFDESAAIMARCRGAVLPASADGNAAIFKSTVCVPVAPVSTPVVIQAGREEPEWTLRMTALPTWAPPDMEAWPVTEARAIAVCAQTPVFPASMPKPIRFATGTLQISTPLRLEQRRARRVVRPIQQLPPDVLSSPLAARLLNPVFLRLPQATPDKILTCARPSPRRAQDWIPIGFRWRRKSQIWERHACWKTAEGETAYRATSWPQRLVATSTEFMVGRA